MFSCQFSKQILSNRRPIRGRMCSDWPDRLWADARQGQLVPALQGLFDQNRQADRVAVAFAAEDSQAPLLAEAGPVKLQPIPRLAECGARRLAKQLVPQRLQLRQSGQVVDLEDGM